MELHCGNGKCYPYLGSKLSNYLGVVSASLLKLLMVTFRSLISRSILRIACVWVIWVEKGP